MTVKSNPKTKRQVKLKEKYEKDVADYKSKEKFDGAKDHANVARKSCKRKVKKRIRKRRKINNRFPCLLSSLV